ncbi:LysM domain/BON superfamily protein [Roseivivax sp. THAF40]|uniref:LysM peptidoglycan-binding domain-containing protein n=1 Tax=unclassified Roseivivax TaxID=2639302 RepID=UPI001267F85D|nr:MULTISPECIES: LysM peptidoglycan-binding domain-containing protein [unclassified Roseivivax]QFS82967.1 LysM domain/BON superfamily protein [Roseivivax sp. THAF197b]QFT46738.1 LysM domain/BON superfamily protein [Roseivivax sp. THAF40]
MKKLAFTGGPGGIVAGIAAVLGVSLLALYATGRLAPDLPEEADATEAAAAVPARPAEGTAPPETSVDEAAQTAPVPEPVGSEEASTEAERDAPQAPPDEGQPIDTQASEAAPSVAPAATETESASQDPQETGPTAPSIDIVRVDRDGSAVIAGRADPGIRISVTVDGVHIATENADSSGNFVLFLDLGTSADARVLEVSAEGPDGPVMAEAEVILAPRTRVAVARAEPDAARPAAPSPKNDEAQTTTDTSEDVATISDDGESGETERADAGSAPAQDPPAPADETEEVALSSEGAGRAEPDRAPPSPPDPIAVPDVQVTTDTAPDDAQASPSAVLISRPEGVEIVQPASDPATPPEGDFVALDSISYDAAGQVVLTGRASPNGSLRVYLDNQEIVLTDVGDSGRWQTDLAGTEAGVYALRLDRVDAEGRVIARIESPFQRESRAALDAASAEAETPVFAVTVQPGNTLWGISRERYGEGPLFVKVFEANRDQIRDPDLIYPGQVFALPE